MRWCAPPPPASRPRREPTNLEIAGPLRQNDAGRDRGGDGFNLKIKSGEIVGIAGVSGNGQSELVEALSGQRPIRLGQVLINNQNFEPQRDHFDRFKVSSACPKNL